MKPSSHHMRASRRITSLVTLALVAVLSGCHSPAGEDQGYEEMAVHNEADFPGLGIHIAIRPPPPALDGRLTILHPLKYTPAWRAGLLAGDRIDMIGDESTVDMSLQEAVSKLRGKVGSPVTITVSSDDGRSRREVTLMRARISVPEESVEHRALALQVHKLINDLGDGSAPLKSGDCVDVSGTFQKPRSGRVETVTLLHSIEVLHVAEDDVSSRESVRGKADSGAPQKDEVTLMVTKQEAEMLVFAQSRGDFSLTRCGHD